MKRSKELLRSQFQMGVLLLITPDSVEGDSGKTIRFSEEQLKRYEHSTGNGVVRDAKGEKASTDKLTSHGKMGIASFVYSIQEKFYLFNHYNKEDNVAHSSFVGGLAKGAGEVIIEDGKITLISSHSGHFKPSILNIYQVALKFSALGVLSPDVRLGFTFDPFKEVFGAPPKLEKVALSSFVGKTEKLALKKNFLGVREARAEIALLDGQAAIEEFERDKRERIVGVEGDLDTYTSNKEVADFMGINIDDIKEELRLIKEESWGVEVSKRRVRLQGKIDDSVFIIESLANDFYCIDFVYRWLDVKDYVEKNMEAIIQKSLPG